MVNGRRQTVIGVSRIFRKLRTSHLKAPLLKVSAGRGGDITKLITYGLKPLTKGFENKPCSLVVLWPSNMFYGHKTCSLAKEHVLCPLYGHRTCSMDSMDINHALAIEHLLATEHVHGHRTCSLAIGYVLAINHKPCFTVIGHVASGHPATKSTRPAKPSEHGPQAGFRGPA